MDENTGSSKETEEKKLHLLDNAVVIRQDELASDIYSLWIKTVIAKKAVPGQFVSVYSSDTGRLLPRPISICEVGVDKKSLRLVYRVVGKGTTEFSKLKSDEKIKILGPLGNGYTLKNKTAILTAGGIGIPPIVELAKKLKDEYNCKINIVAGYRHELFLTEELGKYGNLFISTEDGSTGTKGTVIDAIRENNIEADIIYACGPMPMLRAIKQYAVDKTIEAQISLEERMACGIGACLGCVCKTKHKDGHTNVDNTRICTDGPVFDAEDVEI